MPNRHYRLAEFVYLVTVGGIGVKNTPLWFFTMDKLNGAIYIKWYIKDKKGARKWIYNKADNTGTFIILYFVDMLVKHR